MENEVSWTRCCIRSFSDIILYDSVLLNVEVSECWDRLAAYVPRDLINDI
jgi:hypothetical protein